MKLIPTNRSRAGSSNKLQIKLKMKIHQIVSSIILLFISTMGVAQFSVGLKAGYTKAWEDYGDVQVPDGANIHVNRINISALGYYTVNNYLQVGVEPGYVQRGAACEPGFVDFNQDTKLMLNYIELPLMARGRVSVLGNKVDVIGKFGFGTALAVKAYREIEIFGSDEPAVLEPINLSDRNAANRWDHGIHGGLGVAVKLGLGKLLLESDYYHGFIDTVPQNASQNRSIDLSVGYVIEL